MPRLVLHDRADADIEEIADYIASGSIDAALRFLDESRRAMSLLCDMPNAGARREVRDPRLRELRIWPIRGFRRYLICYLPNPEGIEVLRVLHGARDLDRLFS